MFEYCEEYTYEKLLIGKLIYFYRKYKKISLDAFLYNKGKYYNTYCVDCNRCNNSEIICSLGTLYRIEKGEIIVKKECIYFRLCENLGMNYVFEEKILLRLRKYQELLYRNLVEFSKKNLKNLASSIENDIKTYDRCIYINEILILYLSIINNVLYRKKPEENMVRTLFYLKDHVSELDRKLIAYLLYYIMYEYLFEESERDQIISICNEFLEDELFYDIKLSISINDNYLDSFSMLENEEKNPTLSNQQMFSIIKNKAYISLNIGEFKKSYYYLIDCIKLLEKDYNFSDVDLSNCYRALGIVCFILGNYGETIEYCQKVLDDNYTLGVNICLFFHALEMEDRKQEIVDLISTKEYLSKITNDIELAILNYYREKYVQSVLTREKMQYLEKYICNTIKPMFGMLGNLQKKVFISDLKEYVKKTGNYKYLYDVTDIQYGCIDDV